MAVMALLSFVRDPAGQSFLGNVFLLVTSIIALCPVVVPLGIRFQSYRFALISAFATNLRRLLASNGVPALTPFPTAIKAYLSTAALSTDFQQAFLAAVFFSGRPVLMVLAPLGLRALLLGLAHARKTMGGSSLWEKAGKPLYTRLEGNLMQLMRLSAFVEITLGFFLVVQLFMNQFRGLMQVFLMWHYLKLKYAAEQKWVNTPTAYKMYHRSVWAEVGGKCMPFIQRFPVADRALNYAIEWFQR